MSYNPELSMQVQQEQRLEQSAQLRELMAVLPFQTTEQQVGIYRDTTTFLYADPLARPFMRKVREHMIKVAGERAVILSIVAESGGNNKTTTAGEVVGTTLLDESFRDELREKTERSQWFIL